MRRPGVLFALALLWLLAPVLMAQEKPGTAAGIWHVKLRAGMRQQFEQANKRHMEWHRQQKDTWAVYVWEIVSGDRVGQYGYGSFGHHWKDFDSHAKFDEADMADYYANVAQYVESMGGGYYLYHPEMSRPMEGDAPLSEVVEYHLNVGGESDFLMAVRKIHEAIQKSNYPVCYYVNELYNGGEHPTYVFVFPHKNWADFELPEQTLPAVVEKAYGRDEAESVLKLFDKSVHCVRSQIIADRPDLSYVPAAK